MKGAPRGTNTEKDGARGVRSALVAYSVLVVLQLAAYLFTRVGVLYAQALEMLSDVLVSAFLLWSYQWSLKPPDKYHMFGYGRAQNAAALVAATILIFTMSLEAFREALPRAFKNAGSLVPQNTGVALAVIGVGMIVIAIPSVEILRVKSRGASIKAQLVALLKDEFSYVAAFVGVIFVARGYPKADAIASLVVALAIALGGAYLFRENVNYLLGLAPSRSFFEQLEAAARSVSGVSGVHDVRAEYVGPNMVQASLHIEVDADTPVGAADSLAHQVEAEAARRVNCQYCVVHVDPQGV